jgi:hypothetical protein
MATNQKADTTINSRFGGHPMAIPTKTLTHQPFGLSGIEDHLQPIAEGHRFQSQP